MKIDASPIDERDELASYAYSYPHKSSYRPLSPPVPLREAWRYEDVRNLAFYVHLPFCEMRCGFCNLFTQSQPDADVVEAYLSTLERQMLIVAANVPAADFAQLAVGGGTPTFLTAGQLDRLFRSIERFARRSTADLSTSVETSPATATADRLRVLADFRVRRISLGVQSFAAPEAGRIGRPQQADDVRRALDRIREQRFPVLNIDLIYGDAEQTLDSWLGSLEAALRYHPEELYLYPLYVRPQTGLANAGRTQAEHRADLYTAAVTFLDARGYRQQSLRCFRRVKSHPAAEEPEDATYTCQRDGMIGLGCGARSYTQRLHYGTRFAVTQSGVRAVLRDWIAQSDQDLSFATHGIRLSDDEQRRRFVVLSLLQTSGLDLVEFQSRFPGATVDAFDGWCELAARGWIDRRDDRYVLTASGLQNSDFVGPMLFSDAVRRRLREFVAAKNSPLVGGRA